MLRWVCVFAVRRVIAMCLFAVCSLLCSCVGVLLRAWRSCSVCDRMRGRRRLARARTRSSPVDGQVVSAVSCESGVRPNGPLCVEMCVGMSQCAVAAVGLGALGAGGHVVASEGEGLRPVRCARSANALRAPVCPRAILQWEIPL